MYGAGLITGLAIGAVALAVMIIIMAGRRADECERCRGDPDGGTSSHVW